MDDSSASSTTFHISLPWSWQPVKRRMLPGCELFEDGDSVLHSTRKLIPLEADNDNGSEVNAGKEKIPCGMAGCSQTFTSLLSYENHYNSIHRNTCLTCYRNFPSAYLLDIHIQEYHDPLFSILSSQHNMYRCLLESCDDKFSSPGDRRHHMIKIHRYPANFRFHRLHPASAENKKKSQAKPATDVDTLDTNKQAPTTNSGSSPDPASGSPGDAGTSPRLPSDIQMSSGSTTSANLENCTSPEMNHENTGKGGEATEGMDLSGTENSSAARRVFVHSVPKNFSFGHGISRGFQRPPGKKGKKKGCHWHQRIANSVEDTTTSIENVNMKDMAEALNEAL